MNIFSKLLKKTPKNITANILDPDGVYQIKLWTVGSEVSSENVSRLSDGKNIYVVQVYETGGVTEIICKREIWLSTKAKMDAIDNEGQAAMDKTKEMFDKL